jgi:hypothetical protein
MSQITKSLQIGRSATSNNDIILTPTDVSSVHARLTLIDLHRDCWFIEDLGSSNGTFVDDCRISQSEITSQSRLVFGKTILDWKTVKDKIGPVSIPILDTQPIKPVLFTSGPKPAPASDSSLDPAFISEQLEEVYKQFDTRRRGISALREKIQNIKGNTLAASLVSGVVVSSLGAVAEEHSHWRYLFPVIGGMLGLAIFGYIQFKVKQYSSELRALDPEGLDHWYRSHFKCPKCHNYINDPLETLLYVKICRACKQPLIP